MAAGLRSGWKIATLFGLNVRIHPTWLLIFFLLMFSLAAHLLPLSDMAGGRAYWQGQIALKDYLEEHPEASNEEALEALMSWPKWHYWVLGAVGAVGLFVCVLVHEVSHSLVARAYGIPVEGITLFIFGGVSSLREEAKTPEIEFLVAAAGPLASVAIAAVCWGLYVAFRGPGPEQLTSLLFYFAFVNSLLVGFNLIPGFPLDGGRVLRAVLWKTTGSFYRATAMAATAGKVVGVGMIGLGIFLALITAQFGPLWLAFIGLFLRYAAQTSYQQVALREALRGLTVRDILQEEVVTVEPSMTVETLVDEYFYRHRFRSFPVQEDDRFVGMISLKDVQGVARHDWGQTRVRDAMHKVAEENLVGADDDLMNVFRKMMSEDKGHLPVVEGGRLRGIVTRHDIMNLLQIKTDLGDESWARQSSPER